MHNLLSNIATFHELLTKTNGSNNLKNGNFRRYLNQPKASDLDIVIIAFASEAIQIDSEKIHFSIFKNDYPHYNESIPDRTNSNRRRRILQPLMIYCLND